MMRDIFSSIPLTDYLCPVKEPVRLFSNKQSNPQGEQTPLSLAFNLSDLAKRPNPWYINRMKYATHFPSTYIFGNDTDVKIKQEKKISKKIIRNREKLEQINSFSSSKLLLEDLRKKIRKCKPSALNSQCLAFLLYTCVPTERGRASLGKMTSKPQLALNFLSSNKRT